MKQRRKAAASVVQSLWSTKTTTEKEKQRQQKAKRPIIQIQPGDFGPIEHNQINENDVLCGRGGRINGHVSLHLKVAVAAGIPTS